MKTNKVIKETQSENWQDFDWSLFYDASIAKAIAVTDALIIAYFNNNVFSMNAEKFKALYLAFSSWKDGEKISVLERFIKAVYDDGWTNLIPSFRIMDALNSEMTVTEIIERLSQASLPISNWFEHELIEQCSTQRVMRELLARSEMQS